MNAVLTFAAPRGLSVTVAGQSLGGGLAGLASAVYDVDGHDYGAAPFGRQLIAELEQQAPDTIPANAVASTDPSDGVQSVQEVYGDAPFTAAWTALSAESQAQILEQGFDDGTDAMARSLREE